MTEHAKVSVVLTADFFIPNTQTEIDAFSEALDAAWNQYQSALCHAGVAIITTAAVLANGGKAPIGKPLRPVTMKIESSVAEASDEEYRVVLDLVDETVRVTDKGATVIQHPAGHA